MGDDQLEYLATIRTLLDELSQDSGTIIARRRLVR